MDRKTLLAIAIIGLIILLTPYYYKLVSPPQPEGEPAATDTVAQAPAPTEGVADTGDSKPRGEGRDAGTPPATEEADVSREAEAEKPWYAPDEPGLAETVTITTPLYEAEFSTMGATLRSFRLLPVQPYLGEAEELVRRALADRNLVLVSRGSTGLLRTEEKLFEVDTRRVRLSERSGSRTVTFTLPLAEGGYYRESYTFHPDSYQIDVLLESQGLDDLLTASTASFSWGGGLSYTEEDTTQDQQYMRASFLVGGSHEEMKSNGKKDEEEVATGATHWVAQRTKYFLMALVPQRPASGARLATYPHPFYRGEHLPILYETTLEFDISGTGDLREALTLYLGPLDMEKLRAVEPTLEKTISWGWVIVEPFSRAVYHALVFLHGFIPNYGVVLIIFALLIKAIVFPLTQKSYKSMKRMQVLQPYIKQVQEQYKDNPQEMQKKVMALYKEYKVNPMGGCWPMLLQLPLLYGLFMVFRSTIELRGQPFVLWINDLSMPDVLFELPFAFPLYGDHVALLPVVMGISTYLQSKATMTDPNQKFMLYIMPVMLLFIFNNLPSGLTLYYTLFNLLSWGQQRLMKVSDPKLEELARQAEEEKRKSEEREERRRRKQEQKNN